MWGPQSQPRRPPCREARDEQDFFHQHVHNMKEEKGGEEKEEDKENKEQTFLKG